MNAKKRIAMLLSNAFRPDPRVHKEARSLVNAGYQVVIYCWDRQGEFPINETIDGIEVQRISIRSNYSAGSRQTLYLPRFWMRAYNQMADLAPDIVHCHDLDTTVPGYLYARMHHIPWIYDAHECYPEQIRGQVNRPIYRSLILLERFMVPRANSLITVGKLLADRFRSLGGKVIVVGNYPDLSSYLTKTNQVNRESLNLSSAQLVVAYIGGFTLAREIMPLIESTHYYPKFTVLLAGDGPQKSNIEASLPHYPLVRYLGWIPQQDVPAIISLSDVIYYGLNSSDGNSRYSSPNALYNAMAAGKPILTTDVGEIAQIVKAQSSGLVVTEPTAEMIASAVRQLDESEMLRLELGRNALQASKTTYNWEAAKDALINLYQQLD